MLISAAPTVLPYVRAGRLRALMVTDGKRFPALPDVPTAVELKLPKMVMRFWVGYSVPAGTPRPVVERLNRELAAAVRAPNPARRFAEMGVDPVGNSIDEATRLVSDEMDRWAGVIRAAGIKAQ